MRELIFSLIYVVIGAGLLAACYFDQGGLIAILSVLYFVILTVDHTND